MANVSTNLESDASPVKAAMASIADQVATTLGAVAESVSTIRGQGQTLSSINSKLERLSRCSEKMAVEARNARRGTNDLSSGLTDVASAALCVMQLVANLASSLGEISEMARVFSKVASETGASFSGLGAEADPANQWRADEEVLVADESGVASSLHQHAQNLLAKVTSVDESVSGVVRVSAGVCELANALASMSHTTIGSIEALLTFASEEEATLAEIAGQTGSLERECATLNLSASTMTEAISVIAGAADQACSLAESNKHLRAMDEVKTAFYQNISHEFRTPLTLILAPIGLILSGETGMIDPRVRCTLEAIQRNGLRLFRLVNNLLDVSQIESGHFRLRPRQVDLVSLCLDLVSQVYPVCEQHNLSIVFDSEVPSLPMTLDQEQIEKAIMNVVFNAIKFTPSGGRIELRLADSEDFASLTIRDTGIGIPADMLAAIFDRFVQVDTRMSRRYEGSGIGLSLVKELIELHEGRIGVESELGKGTTFALTLRKGDGHIPERVLDRRRLNQGFDRERREEVPDIQLPLGVGASLLADLDRGHNEVLEYVGDGSHEHSLLLIDDNPDVLCLLATLLRHDYDLHQCRSADAGMRLLSKHSPDLVVCDVMMPGMDGYEFCRAVKANEDLKHIPVLLLTARTGADRVAAGLDVGADDYVEKPFDAAELRARIRALLRMRTIEAELARANQNLRIRATDLTEQKDDLLLATVRALVTTLDAKDSYTCNHSSRVAVFTTLIAAKMGFSPAALRELELASLLHDIGKIGVPEAVLNKAGRLSEEEFGLIRAHPVKGDKILKTIPNFERIAAIVRSHHERYDGGGYPDRLKRQQIPLGSRIMAVADT